MQLVAVKQRPCSDPLAWVGVPLDLVSKDALLVLVHRVRGAFLASLRVFGSLK